MTTVWRGTPIGHDALDTIGLIAAIGPQAAHIGRQGWRHVEMLEYPLPHHGFQFALEGSGTSGKGRQGMPSSFSFLMSVGVASP